MYEQDTQRIRDTIDSKLAELNSMGDRLYQSNWVGKLTSDTKIFEKEFDTLKKLEIIQDLNNYMAFLRILSSIAVIFPYKDLVVSNIGWHNINDYFNLILGNEENEFKILYSEMINYTYFKIIESSQEDYQESSPNYIAVLKSMELNDKPRAVLLLFVDKGYLRYYLRQIAGPGLKELSISNGNINIFDESFGQLLSESLKKQDSYLNFTTISNISSWEYKCVYSNNNIPFQTKQIFPLLLPCILSLVSGFLVAVFLAKVTYKPLEKLINKVFKQNDFFKNNGKKSQVLNEYKLIETSFDKLVIEKETIMHRVKNYENAARCNLLLRLLNGYFEYDKLSEKLLELGLNYNNSSSYCVVLINEGKNFHVKKASKEQMSIQKYTSDMPSLEKRKRLNFIVTVSEVLDSANMPFQLLEDLNDDIAVIISLDHPEKDEVYVHKVIENVRLKIESSNNIKPIISVGSIEKGIIGISKSYQIARKNMECAIFGLDLLGNPKIVIEGGFYYYPTDWEIQLINNLKVGNFDTVARIIDEIKLENKNRQLSTDAMKRLVSLIMETIIRVLNELNINVRMYQREFKELMVSEDMETLWSYLYEVSNCICERNRYANDSENIDLEKNLLQYVNDNYSNSSLSLKELSEVFNMPVSSISKIFKEVSGINFYDYICRLRMEKAKELLKDAGYDICNIAKAVGYENVYSFKRAFLRYEGIKPRDYVLKVVQDN